MEELYRELNKLNEWEETAISMSTKDPANFSEKVLNFLNNNIEVQGDVITLSANLFMQPHEKITFMKHPRLIEVGKHKHDFIELTYAYKGELTQIINGEKVYMREGDLTILDMNIVHEIEPVSKNSLVLNILMKTDYFNDQLLTRLSQNNLFSEFIISALYRTSLKGKYLYFSPGENQKIKTYIESIIWETKYPQLGTQELINCNTIMLFTELLRTIKDESSTTYKTKNLKSNTAVSVFTLIQFISENFMEINLEQTAAHFHIHPRYLTRLLKKYSGRGFIETIQEFRLERAVLLLKNTQLNISTIAEECGFSNINSFYKLFKKVYNKTPKEFRNT
ncbi:AraC family transcriptional regulator [Staphylococcus shinii]|mgnify:CR=1 FL=1|uniref:AraC family transcriptional regulator n=1 Tax=Staphylococcus shinii TaxID=2912228 RepID=UPI003F83685C